LGSAISDSAAEASADGMCVLQVQAGAAAARIPEPPDQCDLGYAAMLKVAAPQCVEACPGACGALNQVFAELYASGEEGLRLSVCGLRQPLSCLLAAGSATVCAPAVRNASDFGLYWLKSEERLQSACTTGASSLQARGPCEWSYAARVAQYAPGCVAACPAMCGPLNQAIYAYFTGGEAALRGVLCGSREDFVCVYASGECQPAIGRIAEFGITWLATQGAFDAECAA